MLPAVHTYRLVTDAGLSTSGANTTLCTSWAVQADNSRGLEVSSHSFFVFVPLAANRQNNCHPFTTSWSSVKVIVHLSVLARVYFALPPLNLVPGWFSFHHRSAHAHKSAESHVLLADDWKAERNTPLVEHGDSVLPEAWSRPHLPSLSACSSGV